jgi:hypothetical protein
MSGRCAVARIPAAFAATGLLFAPAAVIVGYASRIGAGFVASVRRHSQPYLNVAALGAERPLLPRMTRRCGMI